MGAAAEGAKTGSVLLAPAEPCLFYTDLPDPVDPRERSGRVGLACPGTPLFRWHRAVLMLLHTCCVGGLATHF